MSNKYKVAIFIVNYNMPERADALYQQFEKMDHPHKTILIDNGSDICKPAFPTNLFLKDNVQTTRGWLAGVDSLKGEKFYGYIFAITSASIPIENTSLLSELVETMVSHPTSVIVSPALTKDSTTGWQHLKTTGQGGCHRTWMVDNIITLYRASWFDKVGRFDPELIYGWGIDLEASYLARKNKRSIWITEDTLVKKVSNIGYTMNRMNMKANERRELAAENVEQVFEKKYGCDWRKQIIGGYRNGI